MLYKFDHYILDTYKGVLLSETDGSIITDNDRIIQLLELLASAYPDLVYRDVLLEKIWPDREVTDWALARLIADTRTILNVDKDSADIVKTVHGKGVKLAVEVEALTSLGAAEKKARSLFERLPKNIFNHYLLAFSGVFLGILFLSIFLVFEKQEKPPAEQEEAEREAWPALGYKKEKYIEILSLKDNWTASENLQINYEDGVSIEPFASMQRLGYEYRGPQNLNHARLWFKIRVDEEFIKSKSRIRPYALQLYGNSQGEWNCIFQTEDLKTTDKLFHCDLNEPGGIFNINENQSLRLGVRAEGENVKGKVTISGLQIEHANSLVESGWRASNNLVVKYDGGVSFSPSDGGQRLEFKLAGPLDLEGARIEFIVASSEEYIDSGASLLPFAQRVGGNWPGEWGCYVLNEALSPYGARYYCQLDEPNNIFKLEEGDQIMIGVATQRGNGKISGNITVKHVGIVFD